MYMTDGQKRRLAILLRLSKSGNPNEAAIALSRAQRLMQEHNLSEMDVALFDISTAESDYKHQAKMPTEWRCNLLATICKAFPVKAYWRSSQRGYRHSSHPVFIGIGHSSNIAAYAYDVLARQLERDRRAYMDYLHGNYKQANKIALADQFAESWSREVYSKVKALDLTEQDCALVEKYEEHLNLTIAKTVKAREGTTKASRDKAWDAHLQGKRAGRAVNLNRGVDGKETDKLTAWEVSS